MATIKKLVGFGKPFDDHSPYYTVTNNQWPNSSFYTENT